MSEYKKTHKTPWGSNPRAAISRSFGYIKCLQFL